MGPPAPGQWYGGPSHDVPRPGGRGRPVPPPTGTVPWGGRSGGGWDDFFAGTGGTARGGRSPSGAEIARALIEAFRRSRGTR